MGVGLPQDQDFSLSREEMGGWTFGITTTGRERSNQRQNSVALSHKVSDSALTCIRLNNVTGASQLGIPQVNIGRFAAVGDAEGTITLLKLSSNLYEPQPKEKETIMEIFEREKKKAEILKKQRLENEVRKTMLAKEKASKMNHVLQGALKYQACENKRCYPPRRLDFQILVITDQALKGGGGELADAEIKCVHKDQISF